MRKAKVALGLSGGVDSAVSAYLLKKQGFDVSCVYLNCFDSDTPGCRGDQDRKDALAVAMHLGLPFQVLDFRKEYQAAVIDYFKKEYLLGRTPNPDVICNRDIKFGLFLDWAVKNGYDAVATGHYAKIISAETMDDREIEDGSGRLKIESRKKRKNKSIFNPLSSTTTLYLPPSTVVLVRPLDLHKDQTYFLWAVPKEKFKRVLFPLGNLLKSEVRQIAKDAGLGVADKKDSTGICFVGEVGVEDFLKRLGVKEKIGEVVIQPQKVRPFVAVGSHRGVWFYTIGQRHGFSTDLRSPKNKDKGRGTKDEGKTGTETSGLQPSAFSLRPLSDRPPLYVIEKDIKKNRLIVGFGAETYRNQFVVSDTNWLVSEKAWPCFARPGLNKFKCLVRIRHGGELIPCEINALTNQRINVSLSEAQRGIAPGQSAVFYDRNGLVLGGGVIQ